MRSTTSTTHNAYLIGDLVHMIWRQQYADYEVEDADCTVLGVVTDVVPSPHGGELIEVLSGDSAALRRVHSSFVRRAS
jgi:hypothetical protein